MPKEINYLIAGYQRFREKYFDGENKIFRNLVKFGQQPKVLVVACSDSRVDPSIILDCEPGDLFVVRNVANLIPPYENDSSYYHGTSAALEFGITNLNIRHIIVLGHSQCGGINALISRESSNNKQGFIDKWIDIAQPVREQVLKQHAELSLEEKAQLCGKYAVINSINNLMTFPWIAEKVMAANIFLHGWYFDLPTGVIHAYNKTNDAFAELTLY